MFHTDIFVASSVGGIQWVSSRAQGGNPDPCSKPLTTHMIPMKRIIVLVKRSPVSWPVIQVEMSSPNPKAKLARAQSARPMAMYQRAFMRSARMPFTKREAVDDAVERQEDAEADLRDAEEVGLQAGHGQREVLCGRNKRAHIRSSWRGSCASANV